MRLEAMSTSGILELTAGDFRLRHIDCETGIVDENIKLDNKSYAPAELDDGWEISISEAGQFCVNNGNWKGNQIVSEEWLRKSVQIYATPTFIGPYGYYWWIRPDNNAFTASGVGGQYIYIIPEQDLEMVFTAVPYASDFISTFQWDLECEIVPLLE